MCKTWGKGKPGLDLLPLRFRGLPLCFSGLMSWPSPQTLVSNQNNLIFFLWFLKGATLSPSPQACAHYSLSA